MPYYRCTFINDKGNIIEKKLYSESKKELQGLYMEADEKLISIKKDFFKDISFLKTFSRKIGHVEFLLYNQKLITLLKAGITFIKALGINIQNLKRGNLKEILIKAEIDIKNGIQISDAFSSRLIPFQKIYKASLLAGEKSGNLISILEKFNIYLEKISALRRKVISSMTYPAILFIFMISMVLLVLGFAIPEFSKFYKNFEAELPKITLLLISIGQFLKSNILLIILLVMIVYTAIKAIEKLNEKIIIMDYLKLKIPFVGKIMVENAMAIFSRTLSILIAGGIPVPESTSIAIETFSNRYFYSKIKDIPDKIKEGNLLSDALGGVSFVPGIMSEVIRVGESSGNLTDVLDTNANYHENVINAKINALISLIEPILIVILGIVVAFMLIAVYVPIFNLVHIVDRPELGEVLR